MIVRLNHKQTHQQRKTSKSKVRQYVLLEHVWKIVVNDLNYEYIEISDGEWVVIVVP